MLPDPNIGAFLGNGLSDFADTEKKRDGVGKGKSRKRAIGGINGGKNSIPSLNCRNAGEKE